MTRNSEKLDILPIGKHFFLFCTIVENVWKARSRTAAFSLACLKIRLRDEEAIISTRSETDLLAKCFLLHTLSTSILFTCFWIDLVRVLATTGNTPAVAGYTVRVYTVNTRKFKGLDSREITSLPEIKKWLKMARHFNHRRK